MPYCVDIYRFRNSTEYEYKWSGIYGRAGEKRQPRKKPTPEQIRKQNQWKKENYVRRTMKLNFTKNDLWCTVLYPKGTRKPLAEVKKDMRGFLRKMKARYERRGSPFKYMYRIEIGSRGGIHIHMLCNAIQGEPPPDMIMQEMWTHGRIHFERFTGREDDYRKLANYLVKELTEEQRERAEGQRMDIYSSSRNLKRPVPERKDYKRRTVRKLLVEGITPRKGYFVRTDSVSQGVNPYTGRAYLRYTEERISSG